MLLRFAWFLLIAFTALAGPFWIAVVFGLCYALWYQGVELLLIALLVDAYFGYGSVSVPYVTLATAGTLFVVLLLRPHLTLYT